MLDKKTQKCPIRIIKYCKTLMNKKEIFTLLKYIMSLFVLKDYEKIIIEDISNNSKKITVSEIEKCIRESTTNRISMPPNNFIKNFNLY